MEAFYEVGWKFLVTRPNDRQQQIRGCIPVTLGALVEFLTDALGFAQDLAGVLG